jgi:ubiquinone biosynthesis protein
MFSIVNAARDLSRLREIYVVLVRHGFGEIVSRLRTQRPRPPRDEASDRGPDSAPPPSEQLLVPEEERSRGEIERSRMSVGERLRLVAQDLGPSFMKLGQLLSTRTDVIPAEIVNELRKLQDEVPPLPFAEIRAEIEKCLGASLEEVFESVDPTALAAASIGQVHRARLKHDGESLDVVIKVQRPGVEQTVLRDLDLLHLLAALIERAIPESRIYSPRGMVDQFDRAITSELDFRGEADNAARFAHNFEDDSSVVFPKVYKEASAKHVLTLQYLAGRKVYDAIEQGHDGQLLARKALGVVIKQIMEDGFFHADPHPGNILIMGGPEAPVFGMIDLGMVGRLSPELRDKTLDLMVAAVRRDHMGVADAMYEIAVPTRKVDLRAYRSDVSALADKYLGRRLGEIALSALVRDIIIGASRHGLEVPPDFLLVAKALMTVEGVAKEIFPSMDVFEEARPHFLELLKKRYSPQRIGFDVWRGIEKLSGAAYQMPGQLGEVLDDLRMGRLAVRTSDPLAPRYADRLGRRLFTGLTVSAFVLSGAGLLAVGRHAILGIALLVAGLMMLVGHVLLDLRRG